jgi:Pyridine nucleotide-disulphide oxidoreductase
MPFPAPADTYPTKDPVADYLQTYVTAFDLPVRLNAGVISLTRTDYGLQVRTADPTSHARQVIVATGPFEVPFCSANRPRARPIGDLGPQCQPSQSRGPARRAGAGRRGRQLRVPDRRGIGCVKDAPTSRSGSPGNLSRMPTSPNRERPVTTAKWIRASRWVSGHSRTGRSACPTTLGSSTLITWPALGRISISHPAM